jgi:catechol 2,3-dioxygenase-like lactoylglutathione lyase family enzyme
VAAVASREYGGMRILGLVFAGTSTPHRSRMADFLGDTLALPRVRVDGVEADLFQLPDGSAFAVASPGGMGETPRSVGFLVDDLDAAVARLREAGVEVGPVGGNERERYLHFRAPDRELYELVERRGDPTA